MDITSCLVGPTNVVEIFFTPSVHIAEDAKTEQVSIPIAWKEPLQIPSVLGNGYKETLTEYYHRDLCYTYDKSNDAQRVTRKIACSENTHRRWYAMSWLEETLPSHRFPSTTEIVHQEVIQRTSYRVHHRIFFIHDIDASNFHYYYIRYQHSEHVDMKKIQADVSRVMQLISKLR